jgi:uncharacterized protein YcfJ
MKTVWMMAITAVLVATGIGCANQGSTVRTKQGAVGGAAVGAIVGGIVGNQSGRGLEGAAVGGALGAAGGALTGSSMDEKETRRQQGNQ